MSEPVLNLSSLPPFTFDEIETLQNQHVTYRDAHWSVEFHQEYKKQAKLNLKFIKLDELILRHATGLPFSKEEEYQSHRFPLRNDFERKLVQHFPVIGRGTTAVVFDLGLFVLKCVQPDGRTWEFDLWRMASNTPGLFAKQINLPLEWDDEQIVNFDVMIQPKLKSINPTYEPYAEKIRNLYFPNLSIEDTIEMVKCWEWGVNNQDIPQVFDWG
jgi:hypothetical protein